MKNSELDCAAFKSKGPGSDSLTSSVSGAISEEMSSAQACLEDTVLDLVQQSYTVAELSAKLPQILLAALHLKGCQIERYDPAEQSLTLLAGVGDGWLVEVAQPRSLTPILEIYHPLMEGMSVSFRSSNPAINGLVSRSLVCLGYPMVINAKVQGFLWFTRPEQDDFEAKEQPRLKRLVNYVAIALHQAQQQEIIARQNSEIERLLTSQDEFLKLISHELFVPLGNIQLSTQTLEKIVKDASWRQMPQRKTVLKILGLLSQECRRQKQFTDNLMTLIFPDAQKPPEPTQTNLSSWLNSLLRSFEPRFEQDAITLKTAIPKKPLFLECDINQLERAITELLNNALQYTPSGKTVTVTVQGSTSSVKIAIANTGAHIPTKHQPHIFDKFYRIPELDQRQYGGSGLGLALVKQLVSNLGGVIELKSTKQKTTFTVELPR